MHIRLVLVLAALGLSCPTMLTAQQPPSLAAGQHVRVTTSALGMNRRTGTLAEVRGETLLVRTARGLLGLILPRTRIPVPLIDTLEVSLNHGEHMAAQALLMAIGGVAGGVVGASTGHSCASDLSGLGCEWNNHFLAPLLGVALGSGLGLLMAEVAVPERWARLSPGSVRVGVTPLPPGRVGLGASLAF